mmetsp:Transcript_4589/g.14613  ORF Transcript_4589/g.14613 Transcript_4589/m.14613 type:complete len:433 (+) Transcript_4589:1360-2658(+)
MPVAAGSGARRRGRGRQRGRRCRRAGASAGPSGAARLDLVVLRLVHVHLRLARGQADRRGARQAARGRDVAGRRSGPARRASLQLVQGALHRAQALLQARDGAADGRGPVRAAARVGQALARLREAGAREARRRRAAGGDDHLAEPQSGRGAAALCVRGRQHVQVLLRDDGAARGVHRQGDGGGARRQGRHVAHPGRVPGRRHVRHEGARRRARVAHRAVPLGDGKDQVGRTGGARRGHLALHARGRSQGARDDAAARRGAAAALRQVLLRQVRPILRAAPDRLHLPLQAHRRGWRAADAGRRRHAQGDAARASHPRPGERDGHVHQAGDQGGCGGGAGAQARADARGHARGDGAGDGPQRHLDRPPEDPRAQGAQEGGHGAAHRGVQPHAVLRLRGGQEDQKDAQPRGRPVSAQLLRARNGRADASSGGGV